MKTPTTESGELWTLEELTARVAEALSADYGGALNGRVRDLPDIRAIRYYTTLGLIDRPTFVRGRKGYYHKRHLRQLVAIKRLQAQGAPLAEVQQRLAGVSDRRLAELARVPPSAESAAPRVACAPVAAPVPTRRAETFWSTAARPSSPPPPAPAPAIPAAPGPQALRLDAGVVLLLENSRPLAAGDADALGAAARPLLQLLHERGLTVSPPDGKGEP